MIRRIVAAAVVCVVCVAIIATAAPTSAQDAESSEGGLDLALFALAFVGEEDIGDLFASIVFGDSGMTEIPEPTAYNPFRFPVTYDQQAVDSVTIQGMFAGAINFSGEPVELPFDPSEIIRFGTDRTEVEPSTMELPPFGDEPIDLMESLRRAQEALGIPDDEFDDDFRITSDGPPSGPVLMLGARTLGPRMVDCPGVIREYGTVFDTSGTNWDESTGANPQQFNDFFFNGDTAIIDRCTDGTAESTTRQLTFQNPFSNQPFVETAGTATMISGRAGWMMFVTLDSVPDVSGFRFIDFVTDIMAPYHPDYTAASAAPTDLTQLIDITTVPAFAYDPTLNVPETTTTTSSTTTTSTSLAVAPPSSDATTTTVVASGPIDATTGGPIWWMIITGLGLFALGIWFWWQNGNPFATATATAGGSSATTAPPPVVGSDTGASTAVTNGTAVLVPPPDRPSKGDGGGDDTPPKIGLRGWKV